MKPQRCIASGDCFRACVATVCERPAREVPDFGGALSNDCDEMARIAREWLAGQGFGLFVTYCSANWSLEKVLSVYSRDNPGAPVIIAGVSGSNAAETHAVVALNGEIAHDPSGAGIAGAYPCECGHDCGTGWWWIYVIAAHPCEMEISKCAA